MAFRFLSNSAAAARPSAAEGIACILRYNKKDKQRAELFLQLIREYARGKCYMQRIAFAEVCKHMVKRFSSKFVKEWVFDLCLELLYDPVPNVRLYVTHILPALKQTVRLPEDVDLLERLNNAISNSMTDNDRDVSQTARHINDTYKRLPVRMGGSSGTLLDAGGGALAVYEAEDKKKEAEELDCNFAPEDVKEIKAEIVQMSYKKKPGQPDPVAAGKGPINRRAEAIKPGAVGLKTSSSGALPNAKTATGGAAGALARPGALSVSPTPTMGSGRLAPPAGGGTAASKTVPTRMAVSGSTAGSAATKPPAAAPTKPAAASATVSSVARPSVTTIKSAPAAAAKAPALATKTVVSTAVGGAAAKRK